MKRAFCMCLVAAVAGCSSAPKEVSLAGEVYRGHFVDGFEVSSFQPCGSAEEWWMDPNDELYRATNYRFSHGTVYLEVRGHVSPPGHYGHLGVYRRELTVRRVLLAREPTANDCQ
jgi:hypothetical protein